MSTGILLLSFVAAALLTRVHLLQEVSLKAPILVQTKMQPGMEVNFIRNGSDNFRVDFLTADCRIALRIDFLAKRKETRLTAYDGESWCCSYTPKPFRRFHIPNHVEVKIRVTTDRRFFLHMVHEKVEIDRKRHPSLDNITQVLYSARAQNKLTKFSVGMRGNQLEISDNWLHRNANGISIVGNNYTGNLTIDLATNDSDTVALRMHFNGSCLSRNSLIDGQWGRDETNGTVALEWGQKILVHVQAKQNLYIIKVNGNEFARFEFRTDPHRVDRVRVQSLTNDTLIFYSPPRRETAKFIPCKIKDGCEFKMPLM